MSLTNSALPIAGLRTTLEVLPLPPARPRRLHRCHRPLPQSRPTPCRPSSKISSCSPAPSPAASPSPSPTPISLYLIRDAWSTFAPHAADANLTVRFNLPDTCIVSVSTSPNSTSSSTNLFDNAVSYTNAPPGRHRHRPPPHPTHTEFRITNTVESGNQLSPHELPRLFERFWRKDAARSQTGLHAGLGLSLCPRLLALSHASITPTLHADRLTLSLTLPQPTPTYIPA